ncbi:hypothetical protein U1Q18_028169 [Sarracenia purpurea var. burkii]
MAHSTLSLALTFLSSILFLPVSQTYAQSPTAPEPSPSAGPINISAILVKGGQYTTFLHLLTSTHVADQIDNKFNNSNQGMTIFAPTDAAFNNLPTGTLNNLTTQQHVLLVLYHVLPELYSLSDLQTVEEGIELRKDVVEHELNVLLDPEVVEGAGGEVVEGDGGGGKAGHALVGVVELVVDLVHHLGGYQEAEDGGLLAAFQ